MADRAIWAQDEARFGLKTWHRRRWTALGHRPPWVGEQRYTWCYLYGAIEPLTGRSVFWILPDLTKVSVQRFLTALREAVAGEVAVVWDRAAAHRAMQHAMPPRITPVFLPPYSPELNPVEPIWRALRKKLANQIFETLEALEAALTAALQAFWEHPEMVISMTAFPWWQAALKRHN